MTASVPCTSGGARPIDTVQQLANEQTVLAPYAKGHSSHWSSHKEMMFTDLGYKSEREFMAHHVSDFFFFTRM